MQRGDPEVWSQGRFDAQHLPLLEFFSSPNPPYKKPRDQQWGTVCPVMDPIRQIKKAGGSQSAAGESQVPTVLRDGDTQWSTGD